MSMRTTRHVLPHSMHSLLPVLALGDSMADDLSCELSPHSPGDLDLAALLVQSVLDNGDNTVRSCSLDRRRQGDLVVIVRPGCLGDAETGGLVSVIKKREEELRSLGNSSHFVRQN